VIDKKGAGRYNPENSSHFGGNIVLIDKRSVLKEALARTEAVRSVGEAEEKRRAADRKKACMRDALSRSDEERRSEGETMTEKKTGESGAVRGKKRAVTAEKQVKKTSIAGKEAGNTRNSEAKPARKTVKAGKKEPDCRIYVEFEGRQVSVEETREAAILAYHKAHPGVSVKQVELYVKPEERAAYYVVNGDAAPEYRIEI
jgi:hypothetical protein